MQTSEDTTETQADRIRSYLEADPDTPRKVSEVAEAIGADDTRRLGSYLANMATRGSIARAATGLYVAQPHRGRKEGTGSPAETTAAKRQTRRTRRPATKTSGGKTARGDAADRPERPAGSSPQPFHTAGSLDDGRLILRSSDDILWVAQRLNS